MALRSSVDSGGGASATDVAAAVAANPALAALIDARLDVKMPTLSGHRQLVSPMSTAELVQVEAGQRVEVYGFYVAVNAANGPNNAQLFSGDPNEMSNLGPIMQLYTEPHAWSLSTTPIYTTGPGKGLWLDNNVGDDSVFVFVAYRIVE